MRPAGVHSLIRTVLYIPGCPVAYISPSDCLSPRHGKCYSHPYGRFLPQTTCPPVSHLHSTAWQTNGFPGCHVSVRVAFSPTSFSMRAFLDWDSSCGVCASEPLPALGTVCVCLYVSAVFMGFSQSSLPRMQGIPAACTSLRVRSLFLHLGGSARDAPRPSGYAGRTRISLPSTAVSLSDEH